MDAPLVQALIMTEEQIVNDDVNPFLVSRSRVALVPASDAGLYENSRIGSAYVLDMNKAK